ncbi:MULTISPECIES: TenA family transcriptional regulator [Frankia]|jgi:pyrroloquinoline-quinone synthase|uniref:Uncharacterized protein n=1 Tax=Frankia alni (strain DSM 45986 / CECT 9034 / ACN14a) TaxID=326424 RepID=Q0RGT2_FRAAA|nr:MULTISPECIES: iron-containing redox enzyme family protein [Frankia]CAJ63304.1 hypothetical protein FRAAL4662 [Frankia alni ACN14a]
MSDIVTTLDRMIVERKKMTSPLYQLILSGKATRRLLREFVVHRWPIKSMWTRNVLGVASDVDDYQIRRHLVENVYEEETGALSGSGRHLETFAAFGRTVGVSAEELQAAPLAAETAALVAHNIRVCNGREAHFTSGAAAVLLLMEGQPPIVNPDGSSMLAVMRDVYGLPPEGYEFFVHHASTDVGRDAVSELEEEHADAVRDLLHRYCTTDILRAQAVDALATSLELRHRHFDMILATGYDPTEPVFRHGE